MRLTAERIIGRPCSSFNAQLRIHGRKPTLALRNSLPFQIYQGLLAQSLHLNNFPPRRLQECYTQPS